MARSTRKGKRGGKENKRTLGRTQKREGVTTTRTQQTTESIESTR